jgi:predicted amidophosphoribosyltransferase
MNSRQGARYIKTRMGPDLKNKILMQNGIITEQQACPKPSVRNCPKCEYVNAFHYLYCEKCSYPLTSEAYDRIKEEEDNKLRSMEDRIQKWNVHFNQYLMATLLFQYDERTDLLKR